MAHSHNFLRSSNVLSLRLSAAVFLIILSTSVCDARTLPNDNSLRSFSMVASKTRNIELRHLPSTTTSGRGAATDIDMGAIAARSLLGKASSGGSKSSTSTSTSTSSSRPVVYTTGAAAGGYYGASGTSRGLYALPLWARILTIIAICAVAGIVVLAVLYFCCKCSRSARISHKEPAPPAAPVGQGSYYTYGAQPATHSHDAYPAMPAVGQATAVGIPVSYMGPAYPAPDAAAVAAGSQPALRSLQATQSSKSFRVGSYEVAVGPNGRAGHLWRTITTRRDGSSRFSRQGSGAAAEESPSHSQSLRHSDSLQAVRGAAGGDAGAAAREADQHARAGVQVLSK